MPFEDGADDVTPVITRAMALIEEGGRALPAPQRAAIEPAPADHMADVADALRGESRVRTHVVLARLIEHNPTEYEAWTARDLLAMLRTHGVSPRKLHGGHMYLVADDLNQALTHRAQHPREDRETPGEAAGKRGSFPGASPHRTPQAEQAKHRTGRQNRPPAQDAKTPGKRGGGTSRGVSLPGTDPTPGGGGHHGD